MSTDNAIEIWKDIPGYEGLYQASSLGRIKSLSHFATSRGGFRLTKQRILKCDFCATDGRRTACLSKCGKVKTWRVHILVLTAFHGPRPARMNGCHNDGDSSNNAASNLRWDTQSENIKDAVRHGTMVDNRGERCGNAVLTDEDVLKIRRLHRDGWNQLRLAREFGIGGTTVHKIVHRMTWKHIL